MTGTNRLGRRGALGLAAAALAAPALHAEGHYPDRPIRVVVPFTAGGLTDTQMRAACEGASRRLGQPVIVENRAGAGGILGAQALANERTAEGYLLSQMPSNVFRYPLTVAKPPFDPLTDFTWIIQLTGYVFGVAVRGDSPFHTLREMLDYAKANPGRVTYGTTSVGGTPHVTMERIAAAAGVELTHVPFRGSAEIIPNVLGGNVHAVVSSTDWLPLVQEGRLRALCTWGAHRAKRLPDVPTLREIGIDIVETGPYGIAGPKGMAPEVVRTIHDAFRAALEDPAHQAVLERFDMEIAYLGPQDFAASIVRLVEQNREMLRQMNSRKG